MISYLIPILLLLIFMFIYICLKLINQVIFIYASIEVKKANNTRFWNGLEIQLPTYMYAEGIKKGIFLVVAYTDKDMEKIEGINLITESVIRKVKYSISVIVIDARIKPSASLL